MSQSVYYELKETLLLAKGINLELAGRTILRDVNLEVKNIHRPGLTQGQVVGLLGPSGMGKTRLFRILAGLDEPDSGTVDVGIPLAPVHRGLVGVVAQNYPLFDHRTILGNLRVAGGQSGMDRSTADQKGMEFLKRFGLEDHANKYPSQISGGQRQRVAIAQQFMCSDHLLLMDEPFSGLDVNAVDTLCEFIQEVAASDEMKTLVIVTHDIAAAIEVCDTIWVLGRDRNADGSIIPGARIVHSLNLIDRGLAWRKDILEDPAFLETVREIRQMFPKL